MTHIQLPLFLLNTVLFPSTLLTLHVFEERYRLMVEQCLEQNTPFGVVLLKHEPEEPELIPAHYGTVAHIHASVRLEDGRFFISTVGKQRFIVESYEQYDPYIVASVTMLSQENDLYASTDVASLQTTYERYWQSISSATGTYNRGMQLSNNTADMVYQLASRMQVTNERKQHWLEVSAHTRMREIIAMLQAEIALLPHPTQRIVEKRTHWHWSWN